MNSINKDLDRLEDRITTLLQSVADLKSENQRLLEKINVLTSRPSPEAAHGDVEDVRARLAQYIDRLDQCIETIKMQ